MKTKIFGLLIVCIALLGVLDASYITFSELSGVLPPCHPPFDCGKVLNSPLSRIGPVPLSAIGIFYYAMVLIIGSVAFIQEDHEDLVRTIASCGFAFSMYLVFMMGVLLQAWCLYCLVSALCCVLIFIFSVLLTSSKRKKTLGSNWFTRTFHSVYVLVVKPFFFLFDAEFIHDRLTATGHFLGHYPATRQLTRWMFFPSPVTSCTIDGITFPTRVGLSAGFDYTASLTHIVSSLGFGFETIGTITNEPYDGNVPPRLGRLPRSQALLVNKGFKNVGAKAIIEKLTPLSFDLPVGISVGSTNKSFKTLSSQIEDILATFRSFEKSTVKHVYYELNISCPNVTNAFSLKTPKELESLLSKVDALHIKRPVYIKMPIDLPQADTLALLKVADKHTIAGVIFGNLTKDKTNPDVDPADKLLWEKAHGNLSGKPTWNRSNALISMTKKHFKKRFTIIGTGGIFTPEDAAVKIKLGADLVQMITGMIFEGPARVGEIARHISH